MGIKIIAAAGIFLGCFLRALLPYLKKKHQLIKEGKCIGWERRYIWTLVLNLIVALIVTLLVFPTFQIPPENIFTLAFGFGWASQDIVNSLAK